MGRLTKTAADLNKRAQQDGDPNVATGDILALRDNEVRTLPYGSPTDGDVWQVDLGDPTGWVLAAQTGGGGGGGVTHHDDLDPAELDWLLSAHTSAVPSVCAAFDGAGATAYFAAAKEAGPYLLAATDGALPQSREFNVVGAGLTTTDNGAGSTYDIALANDVAAIEALATTGLAERIAANTWQLRTIIGSGNVIQGPQTVEFTENAGYTEQTFTRPTGHTMCSVEYIAGGGGGGNGRSGAAGSNRAGGGGGGSAGFGHYEGPCPPQLFVKVARTVAANTDGERTTVSLVSGSVLVADSLGQAGFANGGTTGGGRGGNGSDASGTAGGPDIIATLTANGNISGRYGSRGTNASAHGGQTGGTGGTGVGGSITPFPGSPTCAGAAGGGHNAAGTNGAGGGVAASGSVPAVTAGTAGGGAGGNGVQTGSDPRLAIWTGGAGGGANSGGTGGKGGDGQIGCGGGGGGAGVTGGAGGTGGPGYFRITSW